MISIRPARTVQLLVVAAAFCALFVFAVPSAFASTAGFLPKADYSTGFSPVSVAVGDLNGDGIPDLATANEGAGGGVSVLLGNGGGSFQTNVDYATGNTAVSVAIGDLNGDGKPDLAVANAGSDNVSVLLGNGDGTFQGAVDYATGSYPYSVAIGDLNGDGKPDLAVANYYSDSVSVLLGNGDGSFQPNVDYATDYTPVSVAIGDLNGDGKPDLATANVGAGTVSVLLGNGDGSFQPNVDYATGSGSNPYSIAIGDLNGDGRPDLATANQGAKNVSVLLGNGDGSFQTHVDYATGDIPYSVAIGDLNGDGKPDLAIADAGADGVSVLLGNGDGSFQTHVDYATGTGPTSVAIGDLNGDGKPDIVTTDLSTDSVSVLLGNGPATHPNATFQPKADYGTGSYPSSVAIGDLNGDGKPDLVTANGDGTISVVLANGDGTFQTKIDDATGGYLLYSVVIGDLNGDGKPDLAVANQGANSGVSVLLGNGDGTFHGEVDYATGSAPVSVAIGDLNGDGKPDLAVANGSYYDTVAVLLGNGDGTFQAAVGYATGSTPYSVAIRDLNGDGRPDLVTANQGADSVSVLLGNGDGSFQTHVDYATGTGPTSVAISDLNGDGKPDLAVANEGSDSVSVLLGNGDGSFQPKVDYGTGSGPVSVAIGDLNGDGKPDLATANPAAGTASVLLGSGDGSFQNDGDYATGFPSWDYYGGSAATWVAIGDLNGDGKPDLAVANSATNNVSVLMQYGLLDHFTIEAAGGGSIGTQAAGRGFGIRVTAQDDTGNTVTSFGGTADISSNGSIAGGSFPSGQFSGGVDSEVMTFSSGSSATTLTATQSGGSVSGTSNAFDVLAADGSGDITSNRSYLGNGSHGNTIGFTYTIAAGGFSGGTLSLQVPSDWPDPPSLDPAAGGYVTSSRGTLSVSADTITVSGLSRGGGLPIYLVYGSKAGGGPGATAPTNAGAETWLTQTQSSAGGSLQDLASSPLINVLAADGSGTISASPTSAPAASSGNTIAFTYAPATGGMVNGMLRLTVPSGWSPPSTTQTDAGYITSSQGTLTVNSRTVTISGINRDAGQTLIISYGSRSGGGPGAAAPTTSGSQTWTTLERSYSATGSLTALANSPTVDVALAGDGSGSMTSNRSYVGNGSHGNTIGFTYTTAAGGISNGALSLRVPSDWPDPPSLDPAAGGYVTSSQGTLSVSGHTITLSGLSRGGGLPIYLTYGSKAGGGLGATAPSSGGGETWLTQSEAKTGGSLQNLATSPSINVLAADGSGTSSASPSTAPRASSGNTITFTYTAATGGMVNGMLRLTVPSGWSAPSTTQSDPGYTTTSQGTLTVNGRTITISGINRDAGQTLTLTYGSRGGGGAGATAPTTSGSQTWTTQQRSSSASGTLTPLTTQPTVNVG